jgi:hypothetical protein
MLHQLLRSNRSIVVPNVVMSPGGRSYDLNSWAAPWMNTSRASPTHTVLAADKRSRWSFFKAATAQMEQARQETRGVALQAHWQWHQHYYAPLVPLTQDAATACLSALASPALENAMPAPFDSGRGRSACRSLLGEPMVFGHLGVQGGYGHTFHEGAAGGSLGDPEALLPALLLEGYAQRKTAPVHKMRRLGEVVELGGVGGAVLLVWANLHREGLIFPPFPYRSRIETEGLAAMARDMGHRSWGMPHVEVLHT